MACLNNNCRHTRCFDKENFNSECAEFCMPNKENDMHIDIYACRPRGPIIWGNVYDNNRMPMNEALVSLVQCDECCSPHAAIINQTSSDINGYYELELPVCYKGNYRIVVNSTCIVEGTGCRCKNTISYY